MNRISLALFFAPVTLLMLAGCQKGEEQAPPVIRPVLSQIVTPTRLPGSTFAGTVQPKVQTAFGPRTTGLLVARDVDTGDVVRRGQLLATLDPTALELAVGSARAQGRRLKLRSCRRRPPWRRQKSSFPIRKSRLHSTAS
jgi:multidrug efflux pump subunit AcrA (membrane-fusion protein)